MLPRLPETRNSVYNLLELIDEQQRIIEKQNETIARLVNETVEQESIINSLIMEYVGTEV